MLREAHLLRTPLRAFGRGSLADRAGRDRTAGRGRNRRKHRRLRDRARSRRPRGPRVFQTRVPQTRVPRRGAMSTSACPFAAMVPVGALNAAGRSDANMSFIAGAALFCDCGGGKIAALFCDCGEADSRLRGRRARRREASLAARVRRRLRGALRGASRRASRRTSRRVQQGGVPDGLHLGDDFAVGARQRDAGRGCRFSTSRPAPPPRLHRLRPGLRATATGAGAAARAGRGRLLFLSLSPFPNGGGSSGDFTRGCIAGGVFRLALFAAASSAAAADSEATAGFVSWRAGPWNSRAGRSVTFGIVVRSRPSLCAPHRPHTGPSVHRPPVPGRRRRRASWRATAEAAECLQLPLGCAGATARARETRLLRVCGSCVWSRRDTCTKPPPETLLRVTRTRTS